MYSFIKGTVAVKTENGFILENNGIGYEIRATGNALGSMTVGDFITAYISENSNNEGRLELFGFIDYDEKVLFERLREVQGVGGKSALNILSNSSNGDLVAAVVGGDRKFLLSVKGIGSKTADRIILELKDKLADMLPAAFASVKSAKTQSADNVVVSEVVLHLEKLGLKRQDAKLLAEKHFNESLSASDILLKCLKEV